MSYDLYAQSLKDDAIDVVTRLRLLVTGQAKGALTQYLRLVHGEWNKIRQRLRPGEFSQFIAENLQLMLSAGIGQPEVADMQRLPIGSWFLQFTFTLAKPYISVDDDPFYVAESVNPVRKDKVFKVPMASAASWKGLLRWTVMQTRLVERKDQLSDQAFAEERFRQALLFGDEKGEELAKTKDWAAHLDGLQSSARETYERRTKEHFGLDADARELPHHSGRLMCYPTFFDAVDVEVINPHSRKTKAGTHPIYLECVPACAMGTFTLLYVPFDLIGQPKDEIRKQAREDLQIIAEAVSAMMLIYGFSAKRSSGYGTAKNEVKGMVRTRVGKWGLAHLSQLSQEVANAGF